MFRINKIQRDEVLDNLTVTHNLYAPFGLKPSVGDTVINVDPNGNDNGINKFTTLMAAINALGNKRLSNTKIALAPGVYNEELIIHSLLTDSRYGLRVTGDLRPFVGIGYNHGYQWNRQWFYDADVAPVQNNPVIGGGNNSICNLNGVAGGNTITVTNVGAGVNPNFVAAGVVAGDKVYLRQITGPRFGLYTVLSVAATTLTFTTNLTGNCNAQGAAMTILPNVQINYSTPAQIVSNITFKGVWFQAQTPQALIFSNTFGTQLHLRGCVVDSGNIGIGMAGFFSQGYDDPDEDVAPYFFTGIVFINQTVSCSSTINNFNIQFGCSFWPADSSSVANQHVRSAADYSGCVILMNNANANAITSLGNSVAAGLYGELSIYNGATTGGTAIANVFQSDSTFPNGLFITGNWTSALSAQFGSRIDVVGLVGQLQATGLNSRNLISLSDSSTAFILLVAAIMPDNAVSSYLASLATSSSIDLLVVAPQTLGLEAGLIIADTQSNATFTALAPITGNAASANTPAFTFGNNSMLTINAAVLSNFSTIISATFNALVKAINLNVTTNVGGINVDASENAVVTLNTAVLNVSGANIGINTANGAKVTGTAIVNNAATPVNPPLAYQLVTDPIGSYTATHATGLVIY